MVEVKFERLAPKRLATQLTVELLGYSPGERAEFIQGIIHNGVFCPDCGYGSVEKPNPRCQCMNDE